MTDIKFHIVQPNDTSMINLIAGWYLDEWQIPEAKTIRRLQTITTDKFQFQVLMTLDNKPISTGGLYDHVGLLDKEPRFKVYRNWLALVYTAPGKRHQGYGEIICKYIQDHARSLGIDKLYLFTDTAERLYKRLGWIEVERLAMDNRNIVVMKKDLLSDKG